MAALKIVVHIKITDENKVTVVREVIHVKVVNLDIVIQNDDFGRNYTENKNHVNNHLVTNLYWTVNKVYDDNGDVLEFYIFTLYSSLTWNFSEKDVVNIENKTKIKNVLDFNINLFY